jgi:hypothetical protein
MNRGNTPNRLGLLFTAACTIGIGAVYGCSTMSDWARRRPMRSVAPALPCATP